MKKTNVLWMVLDLIFLIIFNAVFFMAGGTEHNAPVWASYGFVHFAYFMLLITPKLIRKGKSSAVFGYSLYSISAVYFLVELAAGITFIQLSSENHNIAILVQLCIAGLYGIILISYMIANERTADAEEKRQSEIAYVKNASAKLKILLESVSDKEMKKKVEQVYDAIYSSPVKSNPELAQTENNVLQSVNELERAIKTNNKEGAISVTKSLLLSINERNNLLKSFN